MEAKQIKETMTIRPDNENKGIVEKLEKLAKTQRRSLNNYVLGILSSHVERNKNKIK